MSPIDEFRADAAIMARTMHALKTHGHNHYDTSLNMFHDMLLDVCHAVRREGGDPDDMMRTVRMNFQAEEAAEKLGQEYVL